MSPAQPERSWPLAAGLGVGSLSAACMLTEVLLTRLLSVVIWYHFAFFAISVALLGLGVGALVVHLLGVRARGERGMTLLIASCVALPLVLLGLDVAMLRWVPTLVDSGSMFTRFGAWLLVVFLAAAAPFFLGGLGLGLALQRWSHRAERLYAWDLLGAGLGCALVVPLIGLLGAPLAVMAAAALAVLAAGAFLAADGRLTGWRAGGVVLELALVVVAGWAGQRAELFTLTVAKGVDLQAMHSEFQRWNSFSLVTVLRYDGRTAWGASPNYHGPKPEQRALLIDMNALTMVTRPAEDGADLGYLTEDLSAFAFKLKPQAGDIAVIGAGGGKDVLAGLSAGAKRATAVEINSLIVDDVMRGTLREFTRGLYDRPDVRVVVEDGRSFIRRDDRRYDVILLSMVDTSAATAAGAYALTENSLYTVEAFTDFMARLAPGGLLTVASGSMPGIAVGARLTSIAREALRRLGKDPARGIAVLSTPLVGSPHFTMYDLIVAPDGLDAAASRLIDERAAQLAFQRVVIPGVQLQPRTWEDRLIQDIAGASSEGALRAQLGALPLDVSPTTDDRPFFFYQDRLRNLPAALASAEPMHLFGNGLVFIAKLALVALLAVTAFFFLPLLWSRRSLAAGGGSLAADLGYVSCLGVGFMLLELPTIQRFSLYLGNPAATLAVVLLVLLLSGSLGSRLLGGSSAGAPWRARGAFVGVLLWGVASVVLTPALFEGTRSAALWTRILVAAALLAPLGVALGVPLPAALRHVAARAPERIPWLWGLNGAASVLGSVLATLLGLHAGITLTLAVGLGAYLLALALSFAVLRAPGAG